MHVTATVVVGCVAQEMEDHASWTTGDAHTSLGAEKEYAALGMVDRASREAGAMYNDSVTATLIGCIWVLVNAAEHLGIDDNGAGVSSVTDKGNVDGLTCLTHPFAPVVGSHVASGERHPLPPTG